MKAIVLEKFGEPKDVLILQEVDKPTIKSNEVLIKVHAAGFNYADWSFTKGNPFFMRLLAKKFAPNGVFGSDVAGVIEEVGTDVKDLNIGDQVYADLSNHGMGGFAEYVKAPAEIIARKPENITFEQAAAIPQASVVALQGLRNHGKIQKNQKVLINGASGGIGTFAIQIAKYYGAEVTAVCSSKNLELVKSLGADFVIDYIEEDFTKDKKQYDLILDIFAYRSFRDYKQSLTPSGKYIMVGGSMLRLLQIGIFGGKRMFNFLAQPNKADLNFITELVEQNKIKTVIDSTYTLENAGEAVSRYRKPGAKGKMIVKVI